jgi:phosphoribosyl 1,2-cyclic phosphodiesterase
MLRIAALGSGSRGNAFLIEDDTTCVMLDCGFSAQEATKRLQRLDREPADISAILVTHEHQDHAGGVGVFARRYDVPVWATAGTAAVARWGDIEVINQVQAGEAWALGELTIVPFRLSHDAREPVQYAVRKAQLQVGILTDTGTLNPEAMAVLPECDGLILEANHDLGMLQSGPYPPRLKQRVGGSYGHLSNAQARAALGGLSPGRLQFVVAAHLSEKNNHPARVTEQLAGPCARLGVPLHLADQDQGLAWMTLE